MGQSISNLEAEDNVATAETEDSQEGRYLTFRLGPEEYGIAICHIVEIVGLQKITTIPDQPSFMKGVINLRGKIIPVMDGRIRFGLAQEAYDERTCVIVTDVAGQVTGLIVDRVNEVLEIPAAQVEPPAAANRGGSESYVSGLGKVGDCVKVLLDVDHLFNG
jgi:purine-binding chemotaxis protein CheW